MDQICNDVAAQKFFENDSNVSSRDDEDQQVAKILEIKF